MTDRGGRTSESLVQRVRDDEEGVLVISPHMDDAIFSAASVVLTLPCDVWTVFAALPNPPQTTAWDESCGFQDSDATVSARLLEDDAAFSGTRATVRRFDALEGAYTEPKRRAADLSDFRAELLAWAAAHPKGTIFVPAGAGVRVPDAWYAGILKRLPGPRRPSDCAPGISPYAGRASEKSPVEADCGESMAARVLNLGCGALTSVANIARPRVSELLHQDYLRRRRRATRRGMGSNPDHLALRDAALGALAPLSGITVVAYEELPYSWHDTADAEIRDIVQTGRWRAEVFVEPVDRQLKAQHMAAYVSQLPVLDSAGRLMQAETLPETERFWILRRADRRQAENSLTCNAP